MMVRVQIYACAVIGLRLVYFAAKFRDTYTTGLAILPGLQTVLKVGCLLTETTVSLCLWREKRYQSTSIPKMKGGFLWRVCCGRPSPTGWTSANIASLARRWRGRSGLWPLLRSGYDSDITFSVATRLESNVCQCRVKNIYRCEKPKLSTFKFSDTCCVAVLTHLYPIAQMKDVC